MKILILTNGNTAIIESIRYAFNKCIFTFSIFSAQGYWVENFTEYFSIGYYNSVEDYIQSNY